MALTIGSGPLTAKQPPPSNYEIEGPKHRLLWTEFPRRVRAELGGTTVFDTRAARLLHESEMLPALYVPADDIEMSLLAETETHTFCPFKGEASYRTIRAGDAVAEDAVWFYPEPNPESSWIADHYAFYWDRLDAWYDEDEQVFGHLRDPFHRVDVRASSQRVSVKVAGELVAESTQAWVLSETGLDNRLYIPAEDVRDELLNGSETESHCPYKGQATYWSHAASGTADIAWAYPEPFDGALRIAGCLCFDGEGVEIEVG